VRRPVLGVVLLGGEAVPERVSRADPLGVLDELLLGELETLALAAAGLLDRRPLGGAPIDLVGIDVALVLAHLGLLARHPFDRIPRRLPAAAASKHTAGFPFTAVRDGNHPTGSRHIEERRQGWPPAHAM